METEISLIKKQLSVLKWTLTIVVLVAVAAILFSFRSPVPDTRYIEELTVGTLNIAGPDSVKRMILTYEIGDGRYNGKKIERNVPPKMAGMIFCNPDGDEIGGRGWTGSEASSFAISAFDYAGIPLEAIGFNRIQSEKSSSAQFIVMDNPRRDVQMNEDALVEEINSNKPGNEVKKLTDQMVNRINMGVQDHSAALLISDSDGKPRIKLLVDDENKASISILDENGNEIARIPEEG